MCCFIMRCDVANCQDLFDKGGGHVIPDSRSVPSPPPFRPFVVTWCCCPPSDAHPWLSGTPISIPPPPLLGWARTKYGEKLCRGEYTFWCMLPSSLFHSSFLPVTIGPVVTSPLILGWYEFFERISIYLDGNQGSK